MNAIVNTPAGTPRVRKTMAAAAKGAAGHALAVVYIKNAEQAAEAEVKAAESMKDRLKKVQALDRESHVEFRQVLEARVQMVRDVASGLGISLAEYRKGDAVSNSVISTVSMWQKMSKACEAGFTPNYDHAWAVISMAATDALEAKASTGKPDPETGEVTAKTANPTVRKGRKAQTNLEKVQALMKDFPLQDKEAVSDWLIKHIASLKAPRPIKANAGPVMPMPTKADIAKARGKTEAANDKHEKAVAKA